MIPERRHLGPHSFRASVLRYPQRCLAHGTEQQRLTGESVEAVQTPREEDLRQRHFMPVTLDRVLLDVIQPITPSTEFADAYTNQQTAQQ